MANQQMDQNKIQQPMGYNNDQHVQQEPMQQQEDPFMDTEKRRDMELMQEWNFANSTSNSIDDRQPSQLEDIKIEVPQSSKRNNNDYGHENSASNNYRQVTDYNYQRMQHNGNNAHYSSQQNDENSRYTELSSIRPDSVSDMSPQKGQNQYGVPVGQGFGLRGGPTPPQVNQRVPQGMPPPGPHQQKYAYGNEYGMGDFQQVPPLQQQRRDHDSLLTRVQAVENQTKAELQQIHNDSQGLPENQAEPELSLSMLEEQDPIKRMLKGNSIIEEHPHEDYGSGIGECLDCIRESANEGKKKRKKQKKQNSRQCNHQVSQQQQQQQPGMAEVPPMNMMYQGNSQQQMGGEIMQQQQVRSVESENMQHGQPPMMVNNFIGQQINNQDANQNNGRDISRSYSPQGNNDNEDEEGEGDSYEGSSSYYESDESGQLSDESRQYLFIDDPSAEQEDDNNKHQLNGLGMAGTFYKSPNGLPFNHNAIGRNGRPIGELVQQSHSRESHLLPIQFAKEHIIKIEDDMKKMHERHVKLMREMDQNYKLIEEETQEYYIEFLRKWKEVAKQRILQYRQNTEQLSQEKQRIEKEKNAEIKSLVIQRNKLLKEKNEILAQNEKNIMDRENEIEDQRVQADKKLKKLEQDKNQEILNLQNQKKQLDLQVTGLEARYKTVVEQLTAQVEEYQAREETQQEENDSLKAQIDNYKDAEVSFKAKIEELQKKLDKASLFAQKQNCLKIDQSAQADLKLDRVTELEAQIETLRSQLAESAAPSTQSQPPKQVASAVVQAIRQPLAVGSSSQQANDSAYNYNSERPSDSQSSSLQNANQILIQRTKQPVVRIKNSLNDNQGNIQKISFKNNNNYNSEREQNSGSQPPQQSNQQLQQSILAQINQQNLKSGLKIKPVRGHGGKDLVLKPASVIQNQSFNSVVSIGSTASALAGGLASGAGSRTRQNIIPPMSEQDFKTKSFLIEKKYKAKIDDLNDLFENFNLRIKCFEDQFHQGDIDKGAEQHIQLDRRIADRLKQELESNKTEMDDELARLKRTYEQSQRAQIHQKNIQQNRNSSLQFTKRSDLNQSNLEQNEPLLLNKNTNKIQQTLRIKRQVQQNQYSEHPYTNNAQAQKDLLVNTDTASSSKSNPPTSSDTMGTTNIKIITQPSQVLPQGQIGQQVQTQNQIKQLFPMGTSNTIGSQFNINSAREPSVCQSMRVQTQQQSEDQVLSQQTLLSVQKELQKRISDLTKETELLKTKNTDLENQKKTLEVKQTELEAELVKINTSLMDMSVMNSQLQERSRIENNTNNDQAQKEIDELKEEVKKLKKAKIKQGQVLEIANKNMEVLKQTINGLKNQKSEFKASLKEKEAWINKLMQHNEEICQQLQNERQELISAKNQQNGLIEQNERLWLRFQAETIHRQRLHNTIQDMKGKIRVYCRVRPMNTNEKQMNCIDAVQVSDPLTLKIRVKKDHQLFGGGANQSSQNQGQLAQYQHKEFQFDSCFDPSTNQDAIFQDTKMLIQSAIDGYNVCIFAYGQTGSGKTFTVTGSPDNPGIVPRSFDEMFSIKERLEKDNHFTVSFSCYMVELYLDRLIDLLSPSAGPGADSSKQGINSSTEQLKIREDPQTGMIYIQNVNQRTLKSAKEASDIFNLGLKSRKVGATGMNDHSSRSHLIFSVVIEARNNNNGDIQSGKISFVDLAGSERASKSNPGFNYERQRESNAINLSLKYLGDVISCLSNEELPKTHIPYLNNKLTHLMKDSLGGRAKTLMFVNISPADWNAQESLNSLQFGQRVKMVQNDVSRNIETDTTKRLKAEIQELKKRLGE